MFETDVNKKSFRGDLENLKMALENKSHFAFSKYADGELHILANKPINNGEFWFIPEDHSRNRQAMIDSFIYKEDGYYVGISCPCCIGGSKVHNWMKDRSGQSAHNLTWANIFVNGNYQYYMDNIAPLFKEYEVYLVSNDRSNLDSLPFNIKKHYQIGKNCWVENYDLIKTIKDDIFEEDIQNTLFLFCAGPFGNILAHQLWKYNKKNTYLDIGSTLNPFLLGEEGKNTRGYLRGAESLKQICVWEK